MLTGRQIMQIATRNSAPPWRVSSLRTALAGSSLTGPPLKLHAVGDALGARKTTFFVQVRDLALALDLAKFPAGERPAQLASSWAKSVPSKSTLLALSGVLSAVGGSIVYVDPKNWKTVGIAGSTAALAAVRAQPAGNADELLTGVQAVLGDKSAGGAPPGAVIAMTTPSAQSAHFVILVRGAS
jgi:hypothetical protein